MMGALVQNGLSTSTAYRILHMPVILTFCRNDKETGTSTRYRRSPGYPHIPPFPVVY